MKRAGWSGDGDTLHAIGQLHVADGHFTMAAHEQAQGWGGIGNRHGPFAAAAGARAGGGGAKLDCIAGREVVPGTIIGAFLYDHLLRGGAEIVHGELQLPASEHG